MNKLREFKLGKFLYENGRVYINDIEVKSITSVEFRASMNGSPVIKLERLLYEMNNNAKENVLETIIED